MGTKRMVGSRIARAITVVAQKRIQLAQTRELLAQVIRTKKRVFFRSFL